MDQVDKYVENLGELLNCIDNYLYVDSSPLFSKIVFTKQHRSEKKIREILARFSGPYGLDIEGHDFYDYAGDLRKLYYKAKEGPANVCAIDCYDIYSGLKEVPLLKNKIEC